MDCARVLAKGGTGLVDTDLAAPAMHILKSGVRQVHVVGRRGHVQGAFTIKEIRELVQLRKENHETNFVVRNQELEAGANNEASQAELQLRPKKRIDKLLRQAAAVGKKEMSRLYSVRWIRSLIVV